MILRTGIALVIAAAALTARAEQAVFETKSLTPEAALTAAKAALDSCRKAGYQVSVAVVDRAGLPQVLLRDRYATAHTVDIALDKAWTAASFKIPTAALAAETQAGRPMSGLRSHPRVIAAGGGQVVEAAGSVLGGIAVSGAAGGDADDACARAGIKAIAEALEF